jgi:hypothetical protein
MKKEMSPAMVAVAVVLLLFLVGGIYYRTLGSGSAAGMSKAASPYGLPTSAADFQKPIPSGSGVNAITGEPLSDTAKQAAAARATAQTIQPPRMTSSGAQNAR